MILSQKCLCAGRYQGFEFVRAGSGASATAYRDVPCKCVF